MAAPKRTKAQREYDLQEISQLYLQGWIQIKIVDYLSANRDYNVSQVTISRDIKTIQQRWLESSVRDFDEARAAELAKIDNLEIANWSQFEVSKESTKGTGDPRFLQGVQWCIDRRCKLLGLDAPTKQEITGKDGAPLKFISTNPDLDWDNDDDS